MKKSFILFIFLALLLIIAKTAYNRYCASKPQGCKKELYDENQGLPQEGIDY
ncbi:hypothetical protein MNB_SV-3-1185 [hydrothermal vent metagenome]|uniref:Uncharacterized protein n=1 Tax=hydrothermal vent metagenome TaxID=652676 RepID=A0A1W1CMG6_9ZZZZ